MKFSYTLLKKFVPRATNKNTAIRALTMHSCETEAVRGNTIDVSLPPNRYADMSSHVGVAREIAAALKLPLKIPKLVFDTPPGKKEKFARSFKVIIRDHTLCPRYSARVLHGIKLKVSPKWLQDVLKDCGLRPINNVVDVMNYVMLETGQPLHVFDAKKIAPRRNPTIIIRKAKKGEIITSIDGTKYTLPAGILLIADSSKPLAIAGVKGGRGSEVTAETKDIIIEAANFDPVSIYRTSRALSLATDASIRFSHGLHPALTYAALERATNLLCDIAHAKRGELFDSRSKPFPKHVLALNCEYISAFIGTTIESKTAITILERLGFTCRKHKNGTKLLVEVPLLRPDIVSHEDIAEEIARFLGYQKLRPVSPRVSLVPAVQDDSITLRERVGRVVSGFGFDEVKTHSFVAKEDIFIRNAALELENPASEELRYLRQSLISELKHALEHNVKFFDDIKMFEIGNVFSKKNERKHTEHASLGCIITGNGNESLFSLKGMAQALTQALGVGGIVFLPSPRDIDIPQNETFFGAGFFEKQSRLIVKVGAVPLGIIGLIPYGEDKKAAAIELNLSLLLREVRRERTFAPLPKYPAVLRDISVMVGRSVRIGTILQEISLANRKLIENVDLVDEYLDEKWGGKQSLTFRITFQPDSKTLTSDEIDREMKKIEKLLAKKLDATVR